MLINSLSEPLNLRFLETYQIMQMRELKTQMEKKPYQ